MIGQSNLRKEIGYMANTMNESERKMIPELLTVAHKLSVEDREHLIWLGQGMLFASKQKDDRAS